MKNTIVRKVNKKDIDELVDIWYKSSVIAHDFIHEDYWQKNKEAMKTIYLPNSEIYVSTSKNVITGFVALVDNCLAAIFVLPEFQGKGIGNLLLEQAKNRRNKLCLNVYIKNTNSVEFYKSKGFSIVSESIDEATGEGEFLMEWSGCNEN